MTRTLGRREFIKTGLLPQEIGDRFKHATQLHHDATNAAITDQQIRTRPNDRD